MTNFIERIVKTFGEKTPEHKIKTSIQNRAISIEIEELPLKNPVTVRYKAGTSIKIGIGTEYRPFGEEEVVLAKEIHFFGEGMSNGYTTDGRYFKAMDDPMEITPLEIVENKPTGNISKNKCSKNIVRQTH